MQIITVTFLLTLVYFLLWTRYSCERKVTASRVLWLLIVTIYFCMRIWKIWCVNLNITFFFFFLSFHNKVQINKVNLYSSKADCGLPISSIVSRIPLYLTSVKWNAKIHCNRNNNNTKTSILLIIISIPWSMSCLKSKRHIFVCFFSKLDRTQSLAMGRICVLGDSCTITFLLFLRTGFKYLLYGISELVFER